MSLISLKISWVFGRSVCQNKYSPGLLIFSPIFHPPNHPVLVFFLRFECHWSQTVDQILLFHLSAWHLTLRTSTLCNFNHSVIFVVQLLVQGRPFYNNCLYSLILPPWMWHIILPFSDSVEICQAFFILGFNIKFKRICMIIFLMLYIHTEVDICRV